MCRGCDLRQDFQKRAFSGTVSTNQADHFALPNVEVHIIQGPKLVANSSCVQCLGGLLDWIEPPSPVGPPASEVLLQRAAANGTQSIDFADMFDADRSWHVLAKPYP